MGVCLFRHQSFRAVKQEEGVEEGVTVKDTELVLGPNTRCVPFSKTLTSWSLGLFIYKMGIK